MTPLEKLAVAYVRSFDELCKRVVEFKEHWNSPASYSLPMKSEELSNARLEAVNTMNSYLAAIRSHVHAAYTEDLGGE